ncbi:tetraacyldisaccharide 4'-kinase [Acidocella sp.]|uniref:tetraacyldisaccharide 4'-kinase n=1 Tax=Acidocella sp. TaxID=50710 RepID=UPI00260432C3|nr:tetraacyldisaccharide 4'-kinase [Acidocella sp.]
MKAPAFWAQRTLPAQLLRPFGLITRILTARRVARPGLRLAIPTICVGNAGVGGAGKTIVTLDLLSRLQGRPFALTRGYGGALSGPVLVDPARHEAFEVGDEALLLAAQAPTVVSRDRAAGARLALAEGASAIVMDDGLQNPGVEKTLSFLVIDGGYGFGNGYLLPAGPLREPVAAACARVRAAVLIGADETNALAALPRYLPVLRARLVPRCAEDLRGQPLLAFAGIGRPEKFFASVRALGADLRAAKSFPDHHAYALPELTALLHQARAEGARLVTTTKDHVKLPPSFRASALVVRAELAWEDPAALEKFLP